MRKLCNTSKAGGDAISSLILFIAVLGISIAIIAGFQQFATDTQTSMKNQQDLLSKKINTQYIISNIVYDTTINNSILYIKNTGETELATESFTFFIANEYISSPTIIDADTGSATRLFKPQDVIRVESSINLTTGVYDVRVVSEYGNVVEETFSVE
jgi:archaellum component FlaG (FlaF/FlaG flagellin family)